MTAPRSEALSSLISELEVFRIDLNQYYDDSEPQSVYDSLLSGKLDALACFCKTFGWSELYSQLQDILPLQCTAVEVLARVQNYVLPEIRHLMSQTEISSISKSEQLASSAQSKPQDINLPAELTVPEKVTIPWLLKHVPISLWLSAATVVVGAFIVGVEASKLTLVQQIFSLPQAVITLGSENHLAAPRTVGSATVILPTDQTVRFDASAGAIRQLLPSIDSLQDGQKFTFIKIDSTENKISFYAAGTDKILWQGPIELSVRDASSTFEADSSRHEWLLNP